MQELQAGEGLVARVGDDGLVRLGWGEGDWAGPAGASADGRALSGAVVTAAPDGADDLGAYRALAVSWGDAPFALHGELRAYADRPVLVFHLRVPDGLPPRADGAAAQGFAVPRVAWPHFRPRARGAGGAPEGLRSYAHQWAEFALPVFGDADVTGFLFAPHRPAVVSPLLLIAADGRTLLIGPLDAFHEQIVAVPGAADDGVACGWHGDLDGAPPGWSTALAVWAAPSPRAALDAWTALLRRRGGCARPSRYAEAGLARLSYWTDNGAHYYYRTAPGADYVETLARAVADCEARGLPIGVVQLDSWFYPQEHLRPVSDEGAPIVPPSGMLCWEPRPDLFPQGFADLRRRLGQRPLAFHSRHFAAASPYFARHAAWVDGATAHPQDGALFDRLLGDAAAWGALTYEQDWLVESFFGVRGLRAAPGRARAWQQQLDAAAARHGLTLQWCMATPADFLQTVELERVTSIRTSGDYRYLFDNGLNWVWLLHGNALARALGLNAFKDVFLSDRAAEPYAEIEALLAVMSAGPVGIGDAIGGADVAVVRRTCREDGLLVKPDAPLAAIDRCFARHGHLGETLTVGETLSAHGAWRWHYVVALHASHARQPLQERVALADLGALRPPGPVLVYDWRRGTCERLDADGGWMVGLDFQDWDYRVVCPLLPGARALIGDVARYATMGDRRLGAVEAGADHLAFDVLGVPGTIATIHGWSAAAPRRAARTSFAVPDPHSAPLAWDAASGRWQVEAAFERSNAVRITVHW